MLLTVQLLLLQYTIPKPCSVEYIDSIQTWMDTPEVRTKEQVLLDEFGEAGISGGPMSGAVSPFPYCTDTTGDNSDTGFKAAAVELRGCA